MADNMKNNETLEMAQEAVKKFTYVRFTFFDMNRVPRGKVLPAKAALRLLESGIGCAIGNLSLTLAFGGSFTVTCLIMLNIQIL